MTSRILFILTALIIPLAFVSCVRDAPAPVADGGEEEQAEADTPTNRIDIPATVRRNLGVTFAPVERRRVDATIRIPGAFELQPRARREYRLKLPGRVQLLVDQYQPVEPGDLLFRFQSPEWPELQHEIIVGEQGIASAEAEIMVAEAMTAEAETKLAIMRERLASLAAADFKRADLEAEADELEASLPRLRAQRVLAETKLANAERTRRHALHRAAAATGLDESELESPDAHDGIVEPLYRTIDWIDVVADEAGVVEQLAITDGAFAPDSTMVLSVVDPDRVRFRAHALQADLNRIRKQTSARIVPPMSPGVDISDGVEATVAIGLEAHPEERTMTLLATPAEQRDWIRPGVAAFLEIAAESTGGYALAIPRAAVVRDGLTHVFFRRDPKDPNKAIRVEADLGVSDGRWIAINSGVSLNDQIVLAGAYELKLATQQSGTVQKGGHFHADGTFHAEDH